MSLHIKVNGIWVQAQRPYVKVNNVWVAGTEAYVKRSGVWVRAYEYDVAPPDAPTLTLAVVEEFAYVPGTGIQEVKSRWIKVGVKYGTVHDPELKLIRVLSTFNGGQPTTPSGGSYWSNSDPTYPDEAWSDFRYGFYGVHTDTSVEQFKVWPVAAASGTKLTADSTHYFTAWAQDDSDNWGPAVNMQITIPKDTVIQPTVVSKEVRIQPNGSGTFKGDTDTYQGGNMLQQKTPRRIGMQFYGSQFQNKLSATTSRPASVKVRSAQIFVKRTEDTGSADAFLTLWWTDVGSHTSLPTNGPVKHNQTNIGTIAKGQGKWFELPQAFKDNLPTNIKCIGFDWKRPNMADGYPADYSLLSGVSVNPRHGEVHVIWDEEQ